MYETGNEERDLRKQVERLTQIVNELTESMKTLNDTAMGTLVQLSRLYDIEAVKFFGEHPQDAATLLTQHEQGIIFTTAPYLKQFGAPEDHDENDD
jgi:hypothetical protein